MFRRIGDWFRNFMLGRYGSDKLNVTLLGFGIVVMIFSSVLGRHYPGWSSVLTVLSYVSLFWCIFRMYSRNIEARRRENTTFLNFFNHLKDRDHRYFHCPQCRQTVRVPRGRGKINIRCPRCNRQFIKKT